MANSPNFRGYWQSNDEIFYNIFHAARYATFNKTDYRFVFNNDVFANIDWTVEPDLTLADLYKLRAQTLRDSYSKIILSFSGGSDSTTALQSFLLNGIKIDEIFCYHYDSLETDKTSLCNLEQYKAAYPILKNCEKLGIKINFVNLVNYVDKMFVDSDWINHSDSRFTPSAHVLEILFKNFFSKKEYENSCVVLGLEKPRILIENGSYYSTFLDSNLACMNFTFSKEKNYIGPEFEFFYLTTKMPEITIKQSHQVTKFFKNLKIQKGDLEFEEIKKTLLTKDISFNSSLYYSYINDIIYEGFWKEGKTFSLSKGPVELPSLLYFKDNWIWHPDTSFNEKRTHFFSGLENINRQVDKKFFNKDTVLHGFLGKFSDFYKIADE